MPKNIVICSDGTGNSAIKGRGTNVFKLYEAVDLHGHEADPTLVRQIAFYDDGVGTEAFKPLRLLGGALGLGMARNIRELYADLVRSYDPGDRIYLFGFSRGAYTVRTLAGLIATCGILERRFADDAELRAGVLMAWREYRRRYRTAVSGAVRRPYDPATAEAFRRTYGAGPEGAVDIELVGVWDTVDAVGLPDDLAAPINKLVYRIQFPDRTLSPRVKRACQALSIDDERRTFAPVLWDEAGEPPGRIEQVWFAGVHANVGGGYPKQGMSLVALDWMMTQAEAAGLRFLARERAEYREHRNVHDNLYDSRAGLAVYYRYTPRDIAAICRKHHTVPRIHVTALARSTASTDGYAPGNVPMTADVVVTDAPGREVADAERGLRNALDGVDSPLAQLRYSVTFRIYAHYLFMLFSALGALAAARSVGIARLPGLLSSMGGLLEIVWAALSSRWGGALIVHIVLFWTLGAWAQRSMNSHFSKTWLRLAPRLAETLDLERPPRARVESSVEPSAAPHVRRKARAVSWAAVPLIFLLATAWLAARFFWCWAGDVGRVGLWFCHLSLAPVLLVVAAGGALLLLLTLRDLPALGARQPIPQPRLRRMRAGYGALQRSHQTSMLWAVWLFVAILVALTVLLAFSPLSLY